MSLNPPQGAVRPSRLRVCTLASGSSGNAIVVTDGATTILVDAGISAREVFRRAAECGIDAASVSAIVITHEHSDHVRGVRVLVKRTQATVFASPGTCDVAALAPVAPDLRPLAHDDVARVGTLDVRAFRTSHDAAEPIGLVVTADDGSSLGLMTDTGHLTPEAREALAGCTILALESNHDLAMLERGPYPYFLKRRVASDVGHLSNDQAADALEALAHDRLERVFAMHVSRTNNQYRIAQESLERRLASLGLRVPVHAARHDCASDPTGPAQLPLEHE